MQRCQADDSVGRYGAHSILALTSIQKKWSLGWSVNPLARDRSFYSWAEELSRNLFLTFLADSIGRRDESEKNDEEFGFGWDNFALAFPGFGGI